ncbi:Hsp20/alpha crystallin family protein [Candidatus Sumerlaeota bacterium]|nr:Hsp20/alpha crystallin family protein [Candidatus Sumerlaeota bacterium]
MPIMRWRDWGSPFRELAHLQDEMERLFGQTFLHRGRLVEPGPFTPPIDLYTEGDNLKVRVDLPGVKRDDIKLTCTETALSISGSRETERREKRDGYDFTERAWGEFERTIELPSRIDASKVEAAFRDGVLDLTLPLHEQVKPKQIEVKVK